MARAPLLPRDALLEHEARPRAAAHVAAAAAAAAALAVPAVRAAAGADIVVPPAAVADGLWCCAEIGKAAAFVESNFWTPDSHAAANRPAPAVTPALRGRAARRALTGIAILAVLIELADPDAMGAVDPMVARVSASLAKLLATNRPGVDTPPPRGFVGDRVPLGVDGLLPPSLLRALRGRPGLNIFWIEGFSCMHLPRFLFKFVWRLFVGSEVIFGLVSALRNSALTKSFHAHMAQALREALLQSSSAQSAEYVIGAAFCCYTSILDPRVKTNVLVGCKGENEVTCLKAKFCLIPKEKHMGVSLALKPDEIWRNRGGMIASLALYCVELQLNMPTTLIHCSNSACCLRSAAAFPLADPVAKPVCAVCCVRFLPAPMGILAPPMSGKPLFPFATLVMQR